MEKHDFVVVGSTWLHEIGEVAYTLDCNKKGCDTSFMQVLDVEKVDFNKAYEMYCKANNEKIKECL